MLKQLIPQSIKNVYHLGRAIMANLYFGFPSRKIKVIGITGTNGKTTTTQMVTRILEKAGYKVAMQSTINFKIGDREWVNKTKYTTLSAWQVQQFIDQAVKKGCDYVVLETSSHSLDQYRVWGVDYDVAVITNVTREHLDYHKTMEQYRNAKLRLFTMIAKKHRKQLKNEKNSKQPSKVIVVNLDMEKPEEYLVCTADVKYGYCIKDHEKSANQQIMNQQHREVRPIEVKLGLNGTTFKINEEEFVLNLIGEFNVENALAAISVGLSQDIDLTVIKQALGDIKKVPGRMDYVENTNGITIIIDYALTPDSMEKLGLLIKKIKNSGKLLWVFGSCGDRDRGKRPIMGEIVARYADYAIVTNEDPYTEDPQQIIDEVFSGVVKTGLKIEGNNAWRIMDRREAIKKTLEMAQPGDVVLVTGKGAEEIMAIGDKRIPWNDRQVIETLLKENA